MDRAVRATVAVSSAPRCLRLMRSESTHPRPASGLREKQHSRDSGPRRSLRTVDVAQRLAAAVVATLVAAIAQPEVCVTRAVGAARAARWSPGRRLPLLLR